MTSTHTRPVAPQDAVRNRLTTGDGIASTAATRQYLPPTNKLQDQLRGI